MFRPIRIALLAFAPLIAAACTVVPPEERAAACRATDWHQFGYNDGLLGVLSSERTQRFADCIELGVPVDTAAYAAGRAEGLRQYCTVQNGYDVGRAGRRYEKVCPPDLEPGFLQGYDRGWAERPRSYYYPYDPYYPYWGWWGVGFYPTFIFHGGHHHRRH